MSITVQREALEDERMRLVQRSIEDYFEERSRAAARYGPEFAHLWGLAANTVLGGKFVRPELLVETFAALTDTPRHAVPPQPVVRAAVAVELLHYAFVLHDDVIDGDLVRRGRPNLIGAVAHASGGPADRTSALHLGTTSGILMGDLMLSGVYQLVAELDAPAATRTRLTRSLGETIDETVAGEHADVGLAHGVVAPDLGTILAMSANKTAAYTFGLPLAWGAILADADPGTVRALTKAGRHLGLAFQLQDDLLSVFGDPTCHGKDPASDLREGKVTALIAHARASAQWPLIEPYLGRGDLSDRDLAGACALLEACGAKAAVERQIEDSLFAFRAATADTSIPARARDEILRFAKSLRGRSS